MQKTSIEAAESPSVPQGDSEGIGVVSDDVDVFVVEIVDKLEDGAPRLDPRRLEEVLQRIREAEEEERAAIGSSSTWSKNVGIGERTEELDLEQVELVAEAPADCGGEATRNSGLIRLRSLLDGLGPRRAPSDFEVVIDTSSF